MNPDEIITLATPYLVRIAGAIVAILVAFSVAQLGKSGGQQSALTKTQLRCHADALFRGTDAHAYFDWCGACDSRDLWC